MSWTVWTFVVIPDCAILFSCQFRHFTHVGCSPDVVASREVPLPVAVNSTLVPTASTCWNTVTYPTHRRYLPAVDIFSRRLINAQYQRKQRALVCADQRCYTPITAQRGDATAERALIANNARTTITRCRAPAGRTALGATRAPRCAALFNGATAHRWRWTPNISMHALVKRGCSCCHLPVAIALAAPHHYIPFRDAHTRCCVRCAEYSHDKDLIFW